MSQKCYAPKEKIPYFAAILAMGFCVFLLIAAEFLPVSLLTPIAKDLNVSEGVAGQAASVSGFFAVLCSLFVAPLAGKIDRKTVLIALTGMMVFSLIGGAIAFNIYFLMVSRAVLGCVIGGFWALCTAVIMKMVPHDIVPRALGIVYAGNAAAVAFAPPLASWSGALFGWRIPFWALVPAALFCLIWLFVSLPEMKAKEEEKISLKRLYSLLGSWLILKNMLAVLLCFSGAFSAFTYFRVFLEGKADLSRDFLPWAFFAVGCAAFIGTSFASRLAGRYLNFLLWFLPVLLSGATILLLETASSFLALFLALVFWGGINAAIPVAWSSWLARDVKENPEAGGGLMVAVIQFAIMAGGTLGGMLLDRSGIAATFLFSACALLLSAFLAVLPAKSKIA